jgi:hypothetical protein
VSSRSRPQRAPLRSACAAFACALVATASSARADIVAGADATSAEPSPATYEHRPEEPVADKKKTFVRGYALGGVSDGGVFGIHSRSFHTGAGIDLQVQKVSIPIGLGVDFGETRAGLSAGKVALSGGVLGVMGRFRLGVGLELAHVWLSRPNTDRTIGAIGGGPFALATVDVVDFGQARAFFAGVRPSASWLWGIEDVLAVDKGAPAWRVAVVAGFRF